MVENHSEVSEEQTTISNDMTKYSKDCIHKVMTQNILSIDKGMVDL